MYPSLGGVLDVEAALSGTVDDGPAFDRTLIADQWIPQ